MILVVQRVTQASVTVAHEIIGDINNGMMVLFCAEASDTEDAPLPLAHKLIQLRIFSDAQGKMNLALKDFPNYNILLVPQFTLAADCRKGNRPSFINAAPPAVGEILFSRFKQECERLLERPVATGRFGADMHVRLCNSGPATFILQTPKA